MKNRMGCLLGGVLLLLLLCVGVAGWFFLQSGSQSTRAFV